MQNKEPFEERMEPRIEVEADPEVLENNNGSEWRSRTTPDKKPITRWIIGPILAAALAGLGYVFWLTWKVEPVSSPTAPWTAEVAALKGELQKLVPELGKLKKEVEELRIENKTTVEQLKSLQGRLASVSQKVEAVSTKRPEPAPSPARKAETPLPRKSEAVPSKKTEAAAAKQPAKTPAKKTSPAPAKKPAAKTFVYQVRPGDTVFSLSRKFGVEAEEIVRINDLPPKAGLQVGQLLTIHTGSSR